MKLGQNNLKVRHNSVEVRHNSVEVRQPKLNIRQQFLKASTYNLNNPLKPIKDKNHNQIGKRYHVPKG